MGTATRAAAQALYALVGVILLAAGITVCSVKTGLLPEPVLRLVTDLTHDELDTLHVAQEFEALMVFAGVVSLWFVRHYAQSGVFHVAMTAFWALFALVHWFDVRGPVPSPVGPLVNTAPFVLFAAVGLLRLKAGE